MRLAVFLERDGILNRERRAGKHPVPPCSLEEFTIIEEAVEPLLKLREAGLILLVTTNQPGLSQGILCRHDIDRMHSQLEAHFPLDGILVCPHEAEDHCPCRKPKPGLLHEAAFHWHLDLEHSFVISHKWQDAEAAHLAGCTSVLIEGPFNGTGHHDCITPSLEDAVARVLQFHQMSGAALAGQTHARI